MSKCYGCGKELTDNEDVKVSLPDGNSFQLLACSECGSVKRKVENMNYTVKSTTGEDIETPFKYVAEYLNTLLMVVAKNKEEAKDKAYHYCCDMFSMVSKDDIYMHEIGKGVEILS